MAAQRTPHRSKAGKELYAVRDAGGKVKDIQRYQKAHAADLRRTSKGRGRQAQGEEEELTDLQRE